MAQKPATAASETETERIEDPAAKLEDLAHDAMSSLKRFFATRDTSPQTIVQARVAATVLSAWTRQRQTDGARDAATFMMAREIATNKDELKAYIALTMPDHPIVRAMPLSDALPAPEAA